MLDILFIKTEYSNAHLNPLPSKGEGRVRVNMVCRITYNVYRLNIVARLKLFL